MSNDFKKDLDTYFYDGQFRRYLIQFMAIFSGLKVKVGKNSNVDSSDDFVNVQVRYGNSSRVVDAIISENTQNKPLSLPVIAIDMVGVDLALGRMSGTGATTRTGVLPLGGSLPDDYRIVYGVKPIPYDGMMEVSIYTSNEHEHFQILEQLLMIFDPTLQMQTTNDPYDKVAITQVELKTIEFAKNYPKLTDKRVIVTSLNFLVWFYLVPPVNIKTNFIKSVKLRLDAIRQTENTLEKVSEVNRSDPPYKTLFDIDDMGIPPN